MTELKVAGWVGKYPWIDCERLDKDTWYFDCLCGKIHFHKPITGIVKSDCLLFPDGYHLLLDPSYLINPYTGAKGIRG